MRPSYAMQLAVICDRHMRFNSPSYATAICDATRRHMRPSYAMQLAVIYNGRCNFTCCNHLKLLLKLNRSLDINKANLNFLQLYATMGDNGSAKDRKLEFH